MMARTNRGEAESPVTLADQVRTATEQYEQVRELLDELEARTGDIALVAKNRVLLAFDVAVDIWRAGKKGKVPHIADCILLHRVWLDTLHHVDVIDSWQGDADVYFGRAAESAIVAAFVFVAEVDAALVGLRSIDAAAEISPDADGMLVRWAVSAVTMLAKIETLVVAVAETETERKRLHAMLEVEYLRLQPAQPGPQEGMDVVNGEVVYSSDYRCVNWFGETLSFSPTQAEVVKLLIEAYEAGIPDVDAGMLVGDGSFLQDGLKATGKKPSAAKRVRDIFRDHVAWGTIIVPGGSKGTYRLEKR